MVGKITPPQRQGLEAKTLIGARWIDCRVETNLDQPHIARAQFSIIGRIEQFSAKPSLPFDADHGSAVAISRLL
jgi:hypothetical protein